MIYFISDTHFRHKNLIYGCTRWEDKSQCRPFMSVEEHDRLIINNLNNCTRPNSTIYHCGDFCLGHESDYEEIRSQIKCKNIILIYGNHDQKIRKSKLLQSLFTDCVDLLEVRINDKNLVLCHYPFQVWNKAHYGSYMIHGHCHNELDHSNDGKILDVSVEGHNYQPWSFDEVDIVLKDKKFVAKDHHDNR